MTADTKITLVANGWPELDAVRPIPGSRFFLDISCKMTGDCAIKQPTSCAGFEVTLIRNVVLELLFEQGKSAVSGIHVIPISD